MNCLYLCVLAQVSRGFSPANQGWFLLLLVRSGLKEYIRSQSSPQAQR